MRIIGECGACDDAHFVGRAHYDMTMQWDLPLIQLLPKQIKYCDLIYSTCAHILPHTGESRYDWNIMFLRFAAGPIPDTISICGEPKTPAETITSLLAEMVYCEPPVSTRTPVAVLLPPNRILFAKVDWRQSGYPSLAQVAKILFQMTLVCVFASIVLRVYDEPNKVPLTRPAIGLMPVSINTFCTHEDQAGRNLGMSRTTGRP